jgi:nucleoredoxin
MRFLLAGLILFALASFGFTSNPPPMTVKDVSLMLRSGYSAEDVEREVAARHFMGTLEASAEKNLVQAGASPGLINGLKSGAFAIPASEVAAVQAELAVKEQRRAAQVEEARKLNTLYQAQLAQKRSASAANATARVSSIAALVKGDLVTSQNGITRPYLDAEFEKKKLIGLYFSAHWCGPCRKFTPNLVAFYKKHVAVHPEFEILFVSNDKSAPAMEGYMRDMQMPWPAVSYDKVAGNQALKKYAGSGIPCLVVVDETGKVIFDTYAGRNSRGVEAVLNDLDQFFAAKSSGQIAQAR